MPWLNKYTEWILVSVVSVVVFAVYQAIPTFPDPDSFYHARITAWMLENGVVGQFPWLPFTTLGYTFADHHLLYHIFLMPFVAGLGPLVGVKVAQALLAALFTLVCYGVLKRWQVPYAGLAIIALYAVYPMLIRINLVKASALALIIFVLLLYALLQKRYGWAGVLTVIYSMTHGGFILAIVIAIVVWCAQLITQKQRLPIGPVIVGLGMVVGVIANPYFPNNLPFLWAQFFQIGVVNYQSTIEVGAEWYPFSLPDLVGAISVLLLGVVIATIVVIGRYRTIVSDSRVVSLAFLTVPLLLLTLRSRRFIEYLVPVLWLLVCLIVLPAWQRGDVQKLWRTHLARLGRWGTLLKVYLVLAVVFGTLRPYAGVTTEFLAQEPLERYQAAGEYLRSHIPAGAVVFHGRWDDFPELFYYDPTHAYIVGLDPTFLYLEDSERYQRWVEISSGTSKLATATNIQQYFQSDYVVVDETEEHTKLMLAYLLRDPAVVEVFHEDTIRIFQIQS